jgi:5-methyltetrahydrofolate--homocysteine methyltransferase
MAQKTQFLERLHSGEILLADGATGTNLFARGLPRGVSSEAWVLDNPQEIIKLHQDFIEAGAQIILTCTFGANPRRLEESGLGGRSPEVNQKAVELAQQAVAGRDVLVAGSIGPLGKLLKPYGPLSAEEAFEAYKEQAQAFSVTSLDLLIIETQFDINEATAAVQAVRSTSDLPLVISFSYDRGTRTMMGVSPTKMAAAMSALDVNMLGINCGRSLADNLNALFEIRQVTTLPIWFKPNAGLPQVDEQGNSVYSLSPEEMGKEVSKWLSAGASVIGGCCGTSPQHLQAISKAKFAYTTQST